MDSYTFNLKQELVSKMFTSVTQSGATNTMVHANNAMHNVIIANSNTQVKAISDGFSADADIGKFLERKVKIHSAVWEVGGNLAEEIRPWDLFLNNSAVQDKIANFYLLQGELEVTMLVNGTPFHAGMILGSYRYLYGNSAVSTTGGDTQIVTRSQRPHIWMNVSTNRSGCLCLPFLCPTAYLSLGDSTISASDLGKLNIDSVQPLLQLNAGTDRVTISVFARLINSKLTAPTQRNVTISGESKLDLSKYFLSETQSKPSPQKDDEYGKEGVVSGPASAIASYAGYFTDIPYIGPFATATQMGASAVSGIAKLFGYSKPVVLDNIRYMQNLPISNLALTEGEDTSQKLTVTGKQELCIDPATVGLDGTDELSLSYMTECETYITKFDWPVAAVQNEYIFSMDVDPMMERRIGGVGYTQLIPTSLSFASRMFSEWSGSLEFRFQVIASQYHRGRIGIIYDPYGSSGTDPYNVSFNTIMDLEEARDVTVTVKWQNDRPYLFCDDSILRTTAANGFYTTTTPGSRTVNRDNSNGVLYVQVINELVVPDAITKATVMVSVKAGKDFELVNPRGDAMQVFPYVYVAQSGGSKFNVDDYFKSETQSGEASNTEVVPQDENAPEGTDPIEITSNVVTSMPEKPLMYYGERITSLRQLLKRYCNYRTIHLTDNTFTTLMAITWVLKAFPTTGGFDVDGDDLTASATPYWYCASNYLSYLKYYYAGWRGSIRYKFTPMTRLKSLSATRYAGDGGRRASSRLRPETANGQVTLTDTNSISNIAYKGLKNNDYGTAGEALTQCRTKDGLEVEIPYQIPLRFSVTNKKYNASGQNTVENGYPGGSAFWLRAITEETNPKIDMETFVAAGEDFTFFGRVGAPVLYDYTPPSPDP